MLHESNNTIGYNYSLLPPGGTPALFATTFCLCVYVEYNYRVRPLYTPQHRTKYVWITMGLLLGLIGASNVLASLNSMRSTGVLHSKPTVHIIHERCFAHCRNPIYSFIVWLYLSIGFVHNSRCICAGAVFCFLYLHFLVIPREEAFLFIHFATEFSALSLATTNRWCWVPRLC